MNKHYEYIDALRGMAILGVIIAHVAMFTVNPTTNIIYRLTGEGQRGVQLFYIVSALTLFLSLHSSHYAGKINQTIKYFFRRFFRIAPLFYLLLIIAFIFTFIKPIAFFSYVNKDTLNFITTFTFTNGFFPKYLNNIIVGQWSIAVEMLFYIFVPIFFLKIKSLSDAKKYFLYSLILSTFIELIISLVYPNLNADLKWDMFTSLPVQLPTFMLGFVTFFMIYNKDGEKESVNNETVKSTAKYLFKVTLIAEIIFLIIKFLTLKTIDTSVSTPRTYIESVILLCLVFFLASGYIPVLKNKLFQFFGKISYSLYLTHFAILMLISKLPVYIEMAKHMNVYTEYVFLFIISITISSIVSYLTYTIVEKPGQKFGKYLSKKVLD